MRGFYSAADGGGAVGFNNVGCVFATKPHKDVIHDLDRVFGSRIVAGQDDQIASLSGGLTHQGTLLAVAVTAAAKHGNDSLGLQTASYGDSVSQRVLGVGVVHDHSERLSGIHALEPPWNPFTSGYSADDRVNRNPVGKGGAGGGEDVI